MKNILGFLVGSLLVVSVAHADCADPNLNGFGNDDSDSEESIAARSSFTKIAEVDTAAPAGFESVFGAGGELCRDVTATYMKHTDGTLYVTYTTHDDYCDGGNSIGIMLNMTKYADQDSDLQAAIVGTISDGDFSCN